MRWAAACLLCSLGCQNPATSLENPLDSARAQPGPKPRASSVLTIATYNVLYALAEAPDAARPQDRVDAATLELAGSLEADVIFFQETNQAWESALREVLGERFPHCVFHAPVKLLPEGLGLCSKHPILEEERLPSVLGWFPAQRVTIDWPIRTFEAFNLHLRPTVADPQSFRAVQLETRALREREVYDHLLKRSGKLPTLLLGDLNELPESALFRRLAAEGMDSALQAAGETRSTWRWFGAEPALELQLDHVIYPADAFSVQSVEVLAGGHSDHSAVVVRLQAL